MLTLDHQRNAKTPLAELFENSTLEQMHYSLIMQLMRHHGLGTLLDRPKSGPMFRKLLSMTILATDMSVHNEFMRCYKEMVESGTPIDPFRQKVLVCQALIKCADISNPVRSSSSVPESLCSMGNGGRVDRIRSHSTGLRRSRPNGRVS